MTMVISGNWLTRPATQRVMAALTDAGYSAFFVGGCVRDALLGLEVSDIDIATDARPDVAMKVFKTASLRVIPTGIDHGTLTVMSGDIPHEVTTFRKDVATDGRRATVAFATDMTADARRRDFTMNALYADAAGNVHDPLGGMDDLRAGRVRFIDDANQRIAEDYLRALRFFRFYAWYGHPDEGLDADGLAAVAESLDGLDGLSRERVGAEMLRLLSAPNPAPAVASMAQSGVLARILPGASAAVLTFLVHLEDGREPGPMRRLAALGGQEPGKRLRLSRAQAKQLQTLEQGIGQMQTTAALGYRFGFDMAVDIALLRAASTCVPMPENFAADAARGASQIFPVRADDLIPAYQGPALGEKLAQLEQRWVDSDFALSRDQLLG